MARKSGRLATAARRLARSGRRCRRREPVATTLFGEEMPSRRCNSPANIVRSPSAARRAARARARAIFAMFTSRMAISPAAFRRSATARTSAAMVSEPRSNSIRSCAYSVRRWASATARSASRLASSAAAVSRAIPASAPAILAARCPPASNICANPMSKSVSVPTSMRRGPIPTSTMGLSRNRTCAPVSRPRASSIRARAINTAGACSRARASASSSDNDIDCATAFDCNTQTNTGTAAHGRNFMVPR